MRSSELLGHKPIDLQFGTKEGCKTDSARLVQTDATGQMIARVSEAGVYDHTFVPLASKRCEHHTAMQVGASSPADGRSTSSCRAAIAHCVFFGRVRAVRFGEGERRGNGLSICDRRPGTLVEHGGVQRLQRSLGCGTTPRPGETQTRGLQVLVRAEPEHAEGGATCESVRERYSCGDLPQGPQMPNSWQNTCQL